MKKQKGFITSSVLVIFFAASFGYAYYKITKQEDSIIEEKIEEVIENKVEDLFCLEEGSMNGKIDLTPNSKENK